MICNFIQLSVSVTEKQWKSTFSLWQRPRSSLCAHHSFNFTNQVCRIDLLQEVTLGASAQCAFPLCFIQIRRQHNNTGCATCLQHINCLTRIEIPASPPAFAFHLQAQEDNVWLQLAYTVQPFTEIRHCIYDCHRWYGAEPGSQSLTYSGMFVYDKHSNGLHCALTNYEDSLP